MRRIERLLLLAVAGGVLGACTTLKPVKTLEAWPLRAAELQRADHWQLDGRAAVALGTQGWQASLTWRETAGDAELHLSGPFGVGAVVLNRTAAGLSLNGAPPGDAVEGQLEEKLGFALPLDELRYWLLGVPDPHSDADVVRNPADRATTLTQDGWTVKYDRYAPAGADVLPALMVLTREGVRVRIAIDHWEPPT
jgi:outer membrane lipoprotein LolB